MEGVKNFTATVGQLTRWKERNIIVYSKLHREKQDKNIDAAENWKTDVVSNLLKDYDPPQIFQCR